MLNTLSYKKVLLRERKRHTARRVASTRCAALSGVGGTWSQVWGVPCPRSRGYPVPGLGGTPSQVWGGTPSQVWGVPHPRSGGVPHPRSGGVPHPRSGGVPHPDLVRGVLRVPPTLPRPGMGYPPYLDLGWGTPLPRPEMGYPPPTTSVDRLKI